MGGERCLTTVTPGKAVVIWHPFGDREPGFIRFGCVGQSPPKTAVVSCLSSSTFPMVDGKDDVSCGARIRGFSRCFRRFSFTSSRAGGRIQANLKPNVEQEGQDAGYESFPPIDDNLQEQSPTTSTSSSSAALEKELSKAVRKTAATFAPRSSTAKKNPATPGSTLYTIFEVQAYLSMALGGILSFNLLFPSDQPDLWRLMGMWSVWMMTIPSLRARDCPSKEKDALNYLFLLIPLINVAIPIFWKSFAAVWSADVLAFFAMYAWKLEWIRGDNAEGRQ